MDVHQEFRREKHELELTDGDAQR